MNRFALGWMAVSLAGATACVRVPNPNYVADGESGSETLESGSESAGDGDGDGDGGDGDGDGDTGPGDGDGDGDGDAEGDGDGDPCAPGLEGCPCTVQETCDPGLACVLGDCVDASSCEPVNDSVQVGATPTYMGGDPPPEPPMEPATFICVLDGQDQGNGAVLNVHQCGDAELLQGLTITVQPKVAPIEELLGNPNLAATVTVVHKPEGFFARIEANGMDLYYIDGESLFADGITEYPWVIAPFSSACGTTPSMCGEVERLALLIDGGVVFDGNAGQASGAATAWVEEVIDDCGVLRYEVVLLAY
jgi:hypothetical protein